jgi:predicted nucleic acid-binding protein
MESVYIETTVISYLISRPSRDILVAAHQQTTNEWWTTRRQEFECFISQVVIDEIQAGDNEASMRRIKEISHFPVLEASIEAEHLAEAILAAGVIPKRAVNDAVHIAIAAVNDVDYLLTWNCRHLANAQLIRRVSVICNAKGFNMPVICTPEELMGV